MREQASAVVTYYVGCTTLLNSNLRFERLTDHHIETSELDWFESSLMSFPQVMDHSSTMKESLDSYASHHGCKAKILFLLVEYSFAIIGFDFEYLIHLLFLGLFQCQFMLPNS